MDNLNDTLPWVEKYRPTKLNQIIGQTDIINCINNIISSDHLPNFIFYGPPGTGKTSTINAITEKIYGPNYSLMVLEFNGSDDRGINVVRGRIQKFAASNNMFTKGIKLIILDEVDYMTVDAQNALRQIMDEYNNNVRFCLICNYISKIIPALISRSISLRFTPINKVDAIKKIKEICKKEGCDITKEGMDAVIKLAKGDMRKIYNLLQSTYITYGEITEDYVYQCMIYPKPKEIQLLFEKLLKGDLESNIKYLIELKEERSIGLHEIIEELQEILLKYKMDQKNKMNLIKRLSKIELFVSSNIVDKTQIYGLAGIFILAKHNK
jgi:replication factor C subunit 3/5